ncbi:DnaJ domain-containing protein [Methyloglobulus sp.]|uniref:DnaJ domain-containing protein n=1 Tax=Methyloglobulus sp. TaxID=2518622 RepID=UPI0032B76853
MIRIYLVLLIVVAFYALRAFRKASPAFVARLIRIMGFSFIGVMFLYLGATGRLNGLFALTGIAVAFAVRMLPTLLRYAPYLHRLWLEFTAAKQQSSGQQSGRTSPKGTMAKEEAYEVLGLKPGALEQDIIAAHRKLMQKIHPDRGGSDYLAAKINLAKKILLNK